VVEVQPISQLIEDDSDEEVKQEPLVHKNYSAIFVSASKLEKEYPAGTFFERSFILKNDGETYWPSDVCFMNCDGGDLAAASSRLAEGERVAPGENYTFEVLCEAPHREGLAIGSFSLFSGDQKFGEPVQCSFYVPKLEEDKQAEDSLLLSNRDKSIGDSSIDASKCPY